jgi:hypothetical protein
MKTERELLDGIQASLAGIKDDLRALLAIQKAAGRLEAGNEVFLAIAKLNVWHGEVTRPLFQHWPEHASEIVAYGPIR